MTNVLPLTRAQPAERNPPANIGIEQEVLGCILMAPGSLGQAEAILKPEHFHEPAHAAIYEAILAAGHAQQTPTLPFIAQHLGTRQVAADFGGTTLQAYLARLRAEGGMLSALGPHAEAIRALWALREIEGIGQDVGRADGYDPGPFAAECFDKLDAVRATLAARRAHTAALAAAGRELLAGIHHDLEGRAVPIPSSGLTRLDNEIGGGLQPSFLLTLAARTSMGKSCLGTEIAMHAADHGFGVVYHSLEMHRRQVAARMASSRLERTGINIPYEKMLRRHGLNQVEASTVSRALDVNAELPLVIEDGGGRTIGEIGAATERQFNAFVRKGITPGLVVIDHAHIVRPGRAYKREDEGLKEVADGALALAKRLETFVLLLAQCNRNTEGRDDKRPSLADVRGAGAFEEDSDTVVFLYRPAYYIERSKAYRDGDFEAHEQHAATRHHLEIIIDKNRAGRSNQIVPAYIDVACNAVRNLG